MEGHSDRKTIDALLVDLGGCSRFQCLVATLVESIKVVSSMSTMMMSFGNYNPGWRCLDDFKTSDNFSTPSYNASSFSSITNFSEDQSCSVFESCSNVQFTPGISTVVSEWHLVCDKAWIPSFIISLQMAGFFVGGIMSGYIADKFGRKKIIYAANLWHLILNIVTLFANSWQYLAAMRFLLGMALTVMANVTVVYVMEYAPRSWRNVAQCFPVWPMGCLLFAVSAMLTEDWRLLHVFSAAGSFITLIPYFWVPESLRWLMVNDRTDDAVAVVKTIARLNGKKNSDVESLMEIANGYKSQPEARKYSCSYLLHKGLRFITFSIAFLFVSYNLIYYSIGFGVKALPGNLYTNLIIMYVSESLMTIISSPLPNYTGRKMAVIIFLCICTASLFTIVALDRLTQGSLRNTGILVGAMLARLAIDGAWDISLTYIAELYPTIIRNTVWAYSGWVARIGAMSAPYLISDDSDSIFVNYLIMAVCSLVCCGLISFFPETRGRPMPDIPLVEMKVEEKHTETS